MPASIKVWRPADLADVELRRGAAVTEPYPRHWHEEYQLCLVQDGGGELAYRGRHHATPNDSLFIVHPGEVHANHTDSSAGCYFRSLYIPPDAFRQLAADLVNHSRSLPFFPQPLVFDKDIIDLYLDLHLMLETPGYRLAGESLLLELLVRLMARYAQEPPALTKAGREREAVRRVREYLTEFYAENASLDHLARIAGLSPFHLSRVFCKEVGMPPHAFQTQARVARAKTLIRQGYPLSRVAALTG
ncbi:MAG TPA: AraC family transcriptional regulator, partial [Blastocatellia bacterium]|nr:AraC family transcriptional regulator [Blastocatellia bacterium]